MVLIWLGALAWLVVREYGSSSDREAATPGQVRVPPTATFYALLAGSDQVGLSSITTDTLPEGVRITSRTDVDVPLPLVPRRLLTNTEAIFDRGFRLRGFTTSASGEAGQVTLVVTVLADTLLSAVVSGRGFMTPDTLVLPVPAGVLLPDAVPLQLASQGNFRAGTVTVLQVLDPVDLSVEP